MKNISRLTSGRVPVKSPVDVASDRYQLLDLPSAEPNLGTAPDGSVLTTDVVGTRTWTNSPAFQNLDVANNITVNTIYTDNLLFANGNPYSSEIYTNIYNGITTVTAEVTLVDTIPLTGNSTVKWSISSRDVINSRYKSSTVDSINNGTNTYYNEYGVILSNNNYEVATFTSNISGGNINLYAVGDSANVTVTFQRVALGSSTTPGYLLAGQNGRDGYTGSAGSGGGGGGGGTGYTGSAGSFSGTTSQAIVTTNTTASTSKTTGALRVLGGAGIGGNLYIGGTTYLTGDLIPTANNTVNIGSATNRFGTLYLAANTIDLGGTTITTAPDGELVFTTRAGNVSLTANAINFLSSVANTSTNSGDLNVTGALTSNRIYSDNYFYANGSAFTGSLGYTGSRGLQGIQGTTGYAGSMGSNGAVGATGAVGFTGSAGGQGPAGAPGTPGGGYLNLIMTGALTAPIAGTARFYPPTNLTVNTVYANLSANPTNGNLTFIIKKNGTSIGTTFSLSTALMTAVSTSIALTTTDYLTVDITGSAMASDLHIKLKYA